MLRIQVSLECDTVLQGVYFVAFIYLFIFTFHGPLGGIPLIDIGIVNTDTNTTTQDVYTYEYKHGYEKNK